MTEAADLSRHVLAWLVLSSSSSFFLLSTTSDAISQSLFDGFQPNLVRSINPYSHTFDMNLTPIWPLTWSQWPKMWFCYEMLRLLQTMYDENILWSSDTPIVGVYSLCTDKGSKVIKGVKKILKAKNYEKYSKNHCLYKLHSRVMSLAHMHCY